MIKVRNASERGRASFGWLDSRHTFSFGNYYDPRHMGFSSLRVINDDIVKPGAGFDTHGHRDMEIISLVLEGSIAHKDSEANVQVLPAGEFQLMSAGSGIRHSEYNASKTDKLRFLQIWIEPKTHGGKPGYQQKRFSQKQGITKIVTPTGKGGTLAIKQNAYLSQLILAPDMTETYRVAEGRQVYIHQIDGELLADETLLEGGDGAKVSRQSSITLKNCGNKPVKALIFDLP